MKQFYAISLLFNLLQNKMEMSRLAVSCLDNCVLAMSHVRFHDISLSHLAQFLNVLYHLMSWGDMRLVKCLCISNMQMS